MLTAKPYHGRSIVSMHTEYNTSHGNILKWQLISNNIVGMRKCTSSRSILVHIVTFRMPRAISELLGSRWKIKNNATHGLRPTLTLRLKKLLSWAMAYLSGKRVQFRLIASFQFSFEYPYLSHTSKGGFSKTSLQVHLYCPSLKPKSCTPASDLLLVLHYCLFNHFIPYPIEHFMAIHPSNHQHLCSYHPLNLIIIG